MQDYAPKTFKRNPQGLTTYGIEIESDAILVKMVRQVEQMTPNDALRLACGLLRGVNAYGYSDFSAPQTVQKAVRKALEVLHNLPLQ
jgi:hypothetical protein